MMTLALKGKDGISGKPGVKVWQSYSWIALENK